jgi:hypothetical protein
MLYITPPELPLNVQFVSVGLLLALLIIPPPLKDAELSVKVQLVIVGLLEFSLYITPP